MLLLFFSYTNSAKLRAQLLYQNIRAYTIRIIAKRINKKKEVNPSLKYRVYM